MRVGSLDHYVTLQVRSIARGTAGGIAETWNTLASVWACIEPLQGRELYAAQQVVAELTTRITIRYTETFKSVERVLYGSREYDVLSVINPEERNRELVLMCKEIT